MCLLLTFPLLDYLTQITPPTAKTSDHSDIIFGSWSHLDSVSLGNKEKETENNC